MCSIACLITSLTCFCILTCRPRWAFACTLVGRNLAQCIAWGPKAYTLRPLNRPYYERSQGWGQTCRSRTRTVYLLWPKSSSTSYNGFCVFYLPPWITWVRMVATNSCMEACVLISSLLRLQLFPSHHTGFHETILPSKGTSISTPVNYLYLGHAAH